MRYAIYSGDALLHLNGLSDYCVINPMLRLEEGKAGELTFDLPPDHNNGEAVSKLRPEISVLADAKVIFRGRVIEDKMSFEKTRSIFCKGKLSYLYDTLVSPGIYEGRANEVFARLLSEHNVKVLDHQKILPGTLTVATDVVIATPDYKTTYELLHELLEKAGGVFLLRYEDDGDYLDFIPDYSKTALQKIVFSENLLNLTREVSAEKTYTACIPQGAFETDENGNQTNTRITMKALTGSEVLYNLALVNEYGWIFAPPGDTTFDDALSPEDLLIKGQAYMASMGGMLEATIELSALDLSYTGEDIEGFDICDYVEVHSPMHGLLETYLISAMEIDLMDPSKTKMTLGQKTKTLTDTNRQKEADAEIAINELKTALVKSIADLGKEMAARERYIRYADGVIEMGESGSDLKMRLSNTKISFVETIDGAETEVAWFGNPTGSPGDSKLYIETGEIKKSFQIGQFAFEMRGDNLSLVHKG